MHLLKNLSEEVIRTNLVKKITIDGVTKPYPVYKIKLDRLYYNDQNDRIATWISQYQKENGVDALHNMEREEYNEVIEKFIVSSNPQSITVTQRNIEIVGQREPGVVLSDGRIIDGNRRYTCLRRLYVNNNDFEWFEAIVLDLKIEDNKKAIKLLELETQHGHDKPVDYNNVEKLVGLYRDIIETELLTVEEYAKSIDKPVTEINKQIEIAKLLMEFLDYLGVPKQYHIAREYQLVGLLGELYDLLRKSPSKETTDKIKKIVFMNLFMGTMSGEARKYTADISKMLTNGMFLPFAIDQLGIAEQLQEQWDLLKPTTYSELKSFARNNEDLAEELKYSFDKHMHGTKKKLTRSKPSQVLGKTIRDLKGLDLRIINKLSAADKEKIATQINSLSLLVNAMDDVTTGGENTLQKQPVIEKHINSKKTLVSKPSYYNDRVIISDDTSFNIIILSTSIKVRTETPQQFVLYFVDENYEMCSNFIKIEIGINYSEARFELQSKISEHKKCFLVIKKDEDEDEEVRQLITFNIVMSFVGDFGF